MFSSDQTMRDLVFGNYMEPDAEPKYYDEVTDWNKLENVMNYYMKEYNAESNSPMDLVLFRFAIEHISRSGKQYQTFPIDFELSFLFLHNIRVARILQMPGGNVLMVGLGGIGRRSAVKLAACNVPYQIQIFLDIKFIPFVVSLFERHQRS